MKKALPPFLLFLCFLAFLLKYLYSLPFRDTLLWYSGVFVYYYVPGSLIKRWLGFGEEEFFPGIFHCLALGAALTPALYAVIRRLSAPSMIFPLGAAALLIWLYFAVLRGKQSFRASPGDAVSALILFVFVFTLLHLSYFTDVVFIDGGFKLRAGRLTETVFHLGIVNALKEGFPPPFPYASGVDFAYYHLNMHHGIEMFNRVFSLDTLRLTYFYFPLLYLCLLVFVPYMLFAGPGGRALGVLSGLFMFGSDLSFIPGALGMAAEQPEWIAIFVPTIWSLLTLNSYLPSIFVLALCVFYLMEFNSSGRLRFLLMFGLLAYAGFGLKSSLGFQIAGVGVLAGAVWAAMGQKRNGFSLGAAAAAALLLMALDTLLKGGSGKNMLTIAPFNVFFNALVQLGVSERPYAYLIGYPLYLAAVFGARAWGFLQLRGRPDLAAVFLSIFALSGFFLAEMVYMGHPLGTINNAIWFACQSLMGGWLLLSLFLMKLKDNGRKFAIYAVLILAVSMPSTTQFLINRYVPRYFTVDAKDMEVVKYLESTPPRSVILHPPNYSHPSLSSHLAGRVSVISFYNSFCPEAIGLKECKKRHDDVVLFFEGAANRREILKKYSVDYVYAPASYAQALDGEPMLKPVFKNEGYAIYGVKKEAF